jgi:hypothetical protein
MYLQKVTIRKIVLKNLFFAGTLKVNDENSRIRIQDPGSGSGSESGSGSISQKSICVNPAIPWLQQVGIQQARRL